MSKKQKIILVIALVIILAGVLMRFLFTANGQPLPVSNAVTPAENVPTIVVPSDVCNSPTGKCKG